MERVATGRTADIFALDSDRVLKQFECGTAPDTARREADHTRIAGDAGLPVPTVHDVTSVDGRPAIVYERIDGPTMRSILQTRPWTVRRNAHRLAELQVAIHATRPTGLPSYRERLAGRITDAPGLSHDARQRVLSRLESLPDGRAFCHGDFHPENVLHPDRGAVVIDWLDAGYGHPAADVARTNLLLKYAGRGGSLFAWAVRRAFRWWYLRRYCEETGMSPDQIRAWELPVAAARLAEDVPEAARLRALVDARLSSSEAP